MSRIRTASALLVFATAWHLLSAAAQAESFRFEGTTWKSKFGNTGEFAVVLSKRSFKGRAFDPDLAGYNPIKCSGTFEELTMEINGHCKSSSYNGYGFQIRGSLQAAFEAGSHDLYFRNEAFAAYSKELLSNAEAASRNSTPLDASVETAAETVRAKLDLIHELLESGLITETEASEKRSAILEDL